MEGVSPKALDDLQLTKYMFAVGLTAVAYDVVLTFSREWTFIWSRRWSVAKFLYLLVRYYGLFLEIVIFTVTLNHQSSLKAVISPMNWTNKGYRTRCKIYFGFVFYAGAVFLTLTITVITILRLYALFEHNKHLLRFMLLLLFTEIGVDAYFTTKLLQVTNRTAFVVPSEYAILTGCLATLEVKYSMGLEITMLVVTTILFLLMLCKFKESIKMGHTGTWHRIYTSPLLQRFFESGTIWYFIITATVVVHSILFHTLEGPLQQVGIPLLVAIQSIAGSRTILQLREAASDLEEPATSDSHLGTLDTSRTFGPVNIRFAAETELSTFSSKPPSDLVGRRSR